MRWCCPAFEGHVDNAGKRGLGLFADLASPPPMFVLQFRAIEGQMTFDYPGPVSGVLDVVIRYCPWCGVLLERTYGKDAELLARNDLRVPL